ncbi:potassium channel family protein [Sulfurospirillum sp.]|uniref:potassium channel family protein n=1 Tax=Sulfurospirillum sp. TaxID=2053622 RepID=UPI002FDDFFA1
MRESKILLFGFSRSAIEIGTRLQAQGFDFTCIDNDASLLPKAKKLGFNLIITDYSDDETLIGLGIGEDIKFVFTLFDEDVHNVFLTLSIRALDPKVQIVSTTHTKDAIHKLEIAGASTILDPYQICGKRIYKLITQPEIMQVIDATIFGEEDINMEQITITAHSPLNGLLLNECYPTDHYNMLLIGLHDKELKKEFIFITEGHNHQLDYGDILVVIGKSAEIDRFKMDYSL